MRAAPFALLLAALLAVSACGGPGGPLGAEREAQAAGASRRPLLTPGAGGALPPPSGVFEKARSQNAATRAAARAELMRARAAAGLAAAPERISFLDLPDGVAFASLGDAAFAAPPFAGLEQKQAARIRAGFLDALGGIAPRNRAYLADRRFLVLGRGVRQGREVVLRLRLFDAEGAQAGDVAARGQPKDAKGWLALGRRAAETMLASPKVAAALGDRTGRGFARPAARGAAPKAGEAVPQWTAQDVAIVSIEGAPGNGGAALEAALEAALKARGLNPTRSEFSPHRISARVTVSRQGSKDRAQIRWLFTKRDLAGESVIGEAKQARSLPRGAFEKPWGPLAVEAANAAAEAFTSLLKPPKRR